MNNIHNIEEEIDLINLTKLIWKRKYKILSSVTASLIGTYILLLIIPLKFVASTPFTYINEEEKFKYSLLNVELTKLNLPKINVEFLKNYYREMLRESAIEVLDEYGIISSSSYKTREEFEVAFDRIVSIKGPYKRKASSKPYSLINLTMDNIETWEILINEIDKRATKKTRLQINQSQEKIISGLEDQFSKADQNIDKLTKQKSLRTNYLILNNYLALKQINDLYLLKESLKESPINDENDFKATYLNLKGTKFREPKPLIYLLVLFISLILSCIYTIRPTDHNKSK